MLKRVDAHSADIAEGVYTCNHPETDAEYGKFLYEAVLGEHVQWPSSTPPEFIPKQFGNFKEDEEGNDDGYDDDQAEEEFELLLPLGMVEAIRDIDYEHQHAPLHDKDDAQAGNVAVDEVVKQKGKPSKFKPEHKAWILDQCKKWNGNIEMKPGMSPPPNVELREIIKRGFGNDGPLSEPLADLDDKQKLDKVRAVAQAACKPVPA